MDVGSSRLDLGRAALRWRSASIWLVGIAALLVAGWAASLGIDMPGLYYDEVLFVNAARLGSTDEFIWLRIMGIPAMVMPYLGALKAWIYMPIFGLCPVDAWSVRLPAIVLCLIGSLCAFRALWTWFGARTALVGLALFAFDPTMLLHSRLDWGPNALMFCCRGALLLCLANWSVRGSSAWAWGAFICMAAGLFDKLSFVWISAAATLAVTAAYWPAAVTWWRRRPLEAASLLSLVAAVNIGAVALGLLVDSDPSVSNWPDRIAVAQHLLKHALLGGGALEFISGSGLRFSAPLAWCIGALLLLAFVGALQMLKDRAPALRPWAFLVALNLLTIAAFIVTARATGPHHSAVVAGMWQLALAPPLAMTMSCGRGWPRASIRALVAGAVLAASCAMMYSTVRALHTMRDEVRNPHWDPAHWTLGQHVASRPGDRFIYADWGLGNLALAACAKDSWRAADFWPAFTTPEGARDVVQQELANGRFFIVAKIPPHEAIAGTYGNAMRAIESMGATRRPVLVLHGLRGDPLIEVIEVTSRTQGSP